MDRLVLDKKKLYFKKISFWNKNSETKGNNIKLPLNGQLGPDMYEVIWASSEYVPVFLKSGWTRICLSPAWPGPRTTLLESLFFFFLKKKRNHRPNHADRTHIDPTFWSKLFITCPTVIVHALMNPLSSSSIPSNVYSWQVVWNKWT